jgi:hypothetical protein
MEWRPVPDACAMAVSEFGDVKRVAPGRSNSCVIGRLARPHRGAYLRVYITQDSGEKRVWIVSRLVATVFIGPAPSASHQAAHRDGNSWNNHWRNLYWATPKENSADRWNHGTVPLGERAGPVSLSGRSVELIKALAGYGVPQDLIAEAFDTSQSHVGRVVRGQLWGKASC